MNDAGEGSSTITTRPARAALSNASGKSSAKATRRSAGPMRPILAITSTVLPAGTSQVARAPSMELILSASSSCFTLMSSPFERRAECASRPDGALGTRVPQIRYRRSAISSEMSAMNSSRSAECVPFVRSRTELVPASTSFSPRISM